MNFFWKLLLISGIGFVVNSCDPYDLEGTVRDGLNNMEFVCYDSTSNYYFRGLFGEDSICAYDGENSYTADFGIGNSFITLNRTSPNENLPSQESMSFVECLVYKIDETIPYVPKYGHKIIEEIYMKAQPCKSGTPLDSMVRAFMVKGIHPVKGELKDGSISHEGFEILLDKVYSNTDLNPDHRTITFTSALGEQPSDSYVNILDISLTQNGEYIEGFVHLNLKCKMYLSNSGKLTGTFARDFSGEFNLPIRYKL